MMIELVLRDGKRALFGVGSVDMVVDTGFDEVELVVRGNRYQVRHSYTDMVRKLQQAGVGIVELSSTVDGGAPVV